MSYNSDIEISKKKQLLRDSRVFYRDFVNNRNVNPVASTAAQLALTRASTATYVNSSGLVTTAAIDEARFDYNPVTLESEGLLLERASTNLFQYSSDIDNVYWSYSAAAIGTGFTSPSGSTDAKSIKGDNTLNIHQFYRAVTVTSGAAYTLSIFAKAGANNFVILNLSDSTNRRTWFNLATGLVGTVEPGTTASITSYGNGWYRCSVSRVVDSTSSVLVFNSAISDGASTYTGSNVDDTYVWGAQLEISTTGVGNPTSYIPTTSATVTRSSDSLSMNSTELNKILNSAESTMLIKYDSGNVSSASLRPYSLVEDSNTKVFAITHAASNSRVCRSGSTPFSPSLQAVTPYTVYTSVLAYDDTVDAFCARNGVYADFTVPAGRIHPTSIIVGSWFFGYEWHMNGHVKTLVYYNKKLPKRLVKALSL